MHKLMRDRVIDTNKLYKHLFPKDNKSNLAYLVEQFMKKKVSKYEQCSGWRNRPLRRAQMHYAALDCVLPVRIGQIL